MSTLAVNNITDSTGLVAPIFPPGSAQLNPLAEREDRIINGDFTIWQRGVPSSSVLGYVGPDRWANSGSTGTITHSIQAFPPGEKLGATNPYQCLRQTVSGQSAPSSYAATTQRIESVRSYSGETITVLFWARRASGVGNMSVDIDQVFGTGGTPSANVLGFGTTPITLSNNWTPYAVVISVPSISGKVLGTLGGDYLGLNFWTSAGSVYNARTNNLGLQNIAVDLWGVHIRLGAWTAAATADHRTRDLTNEFVLCQRYFEVTVAYIYETNLPALTQAVSPVYFRVPKRVVPNMLFLSEIQSVNAQSRTVDQVTPYTCRAYVTAIGTGTTAYGVYMSADAEIY